MRFVGLMTGVLGLGLLAASFPNAAFAQTLPNFQQAGFPQIIATRTISPTAGPTTVTAGDITVTIPTGAFGADPVTFDILQGPASNMTPSGTNAVTDWAFKVTDNTTGAVVTQFTQPVTASVTAPAINSASEYWNVSPTGGLSLNPVAPTITGDTLTHKIAADVVGWVVANPSPATDFTQHGFPTILASTAFTPGTAATLAVNGISISIPANAFSIPVTVQLLQGPTAQFQSSLSAGQRVVTDFALKVLDPATNQLVSTFNAPVVAKITSPQINQKSQYLDVSPTGTIEANPIPSTIVGHVMTHKIAAAAVGWVVSTPTPSATPSPSQAPDFTQHGFQKVIASTAFTPGKAASVTAHGIHIAIPANAFTVPVTVQLLQGSAQHFASSIPSGQSVVTDFALKVMNPTTHQLVVTFNAPVMATVTASQINSQSEYLDVSPSGTITANPIPPAISGDVMTHAIKAAAVGWVITSPSVPEATAPVTGLPLAPVMAGGAILILGGVGLLLRSGIRGSIKQ